MPTLFDKEILFSLSDSDLDITQIQNSFLSIVLTAYVQFDNKFEIFEESYKDGTVLFNGLKSAGLIIREYTIYHKGRTIDGILEIEEAIKDQVSIPYTMPIRFRLSIPLDDILVFNGFTDYPNSLFGGLKTKFKINSNAFVFAQVNPIVNMAKYHTLNKTALLANRTDKLKNIDLLLRNWSLGQQNTKQFTQMGRTTDLITKISIEQVTDRRLKNLMYSISSVILPIKNYSITEETDNMSGYEAIDDCLQRVREFYANRPFVVPSQRVEAWSFPTSATTIEIRTSQNIPFFHVTDLCLLFPKDARATTCYENPCYHNMQITTCGRNFPDMRMNTLDQQFFQMKLNASNLDLLFEATDEFEDILTTPRNTASRRLNPHTDLTSFMITLQCEQLRGASIYQGDTVCYYNVDLKGKKLPLPILRTIHDTFLLFGPTNGGSCVYDVNNTFEEVISQIEG
ncbi:MAG: hypothetical protein EZS28_038293 [Streblomastix strix]|uniref:Uncharacterized protein n=1 Tax=Streblomastix strix TaxID=222440 RepID=A0A5J4U7L1_9EUKA|nr:MAG: hypothetical protein EZS28_038293 [Streblomastix strix]